MLSSSSFNSLLKSNEQPPPHVVFMMATTELQKIPDTVLSRSQVYEFRTIPAKLVAERLRQIAGEEHIQIPDTALLLLARAGEGSMRDSLSAFDQVRAFAGDTIEVEDVVTVLGLVGRDLVLDMLDAVAGEDAPAAFMLVDRAIERGYDLRLLCRELARATRDLLLLSVDRTRVDDPDIAAEGERDRLKHLVDLSSREDLLRAFDVLTRAEQELRTSDQPRYNLEMALLRLMHLRKLVPLTELIGTGAGSGGSRPVAAAAGAAAASAGARGVTAAPRPMQAPVRPAAALPRAAVTPAAAVVPTSPGSPEDLKAAFLAQVKASKVFFYNTVVAQAYRVDATPSRITFTFLPHQKVPRQQCEDMKAFLEDIAQKVAGTRISVAVAIADAGAPAANSPATSNQAASTAAATTAAEDLRQEALSDPTVQALLEIFPVEKTKIEEM